MESVVSSLDAGKAFEPVQWEHLLLVFQCFRFNNQVVGCLKSLHCSPTARMEINRNLSVFLESTHQQGCIGTGS